MLSTLLPWAGLPARESARPQEANSPRAYMHACWHTCHAGAYPVPLQVLPACLARLEQGWWQVQVTGVADGQLNASTR
jgi:hypothetical protein